MVKEIPLSIVIKTCLESSIVAVILNKTKKENKTAEYGYFNIVFIKFSNQVFYRLFIFLNSLMFLRPI